MNLTAIYIFVLTMMTSQILFDFNKTANISNWQIVDDVVMGGRSNGTFKLNKEGFGAFEGTISLENNGGFSSIRYGFAKTNVKSFYKIVLFVKGDAKEYQFRIKESSRDYYAYIYPFKTSGDWQEIEIPLKDMYPSFRGRRLNAANFSGNSIEEITLLIGNKKNEHFKILIDKIELR